MPRRRQRSRKQQQQDLKNKSARIHIPTRIQRKVASIVQDILEQKRQAQAQAQKQQEEATHKGSEPEDGSPQHVSTKNNDNNLPQQLADSFQKALERQLKLVHLESDKINTIFANSHEKDDKNDDTLSESLTSYAIDAWNQQQLAIQVFHYLDHGGKGVVVVQDLQQVADEFLKNDNNNTNGEDAALDLEDLQEMITLAGGASSDGLLSQNDFVQIARKVNLQNV